MTLLAMKCDTISSPCAVITTLQFAAILRGCHNVAFGRTSFFAPPLIFRGDTPCTSRQQNYQMVQRGSAAPTTVNKMASLSPHVQESGDFRGMYTTPSRYWRRFFYHHIVMKRHTWAAGTLLIRLLKTTTGSCQRRLSLWLMNWRLSSSAGAVEEDFGLWYD